MIVVVGIVAIAVAHCVSPIAGDGPDLGNPMPPPPPSSVLQYTLSQTCSNPVMNDILKSRIHCRGPKATLVDLNHHAWNMSVPTDDVIQIIPNVVSVNRCSGNCPRTSHRCVPRSVRMKQVPVMLVMALFPAGIHETRCGHVDVEEHVSCGCDCPISPEQCLRSPDETLASSPRVFDPRTCRCKCRDAEARRSCKSRRMEWDDDNCRCICPPSKWQMCSTGFIFDFGPKCHCTPANMTASLGLIAALVVLILCLMVTLVGGFVMYRRKTGLFQGRRSNSRTQLHAERKAGIIRTLGVDMGSSQRPLEVVPPRKPPTIKNKEREPMLTPTASPRDVIMSSQFTMKS